MKLLNRSILALTFVMLFACEKNEDPNIPISDELIGYWVNPSYNNDTIVYQRANELNENKHGLAFMANENFVERNIVGWCGTPPVTYANYEGSWTQSNAIIDIDVAYWGGKADYQWELISIENNRLKIHIIKQDYQDTME